MTRRVTGSHQYPLVATAVITPATAAGDWAEVRKIFSIPDDALLVFGFIDVIQAFDDSSTLTIDIGENVDPDRFTASPIDLKTTGPTALTAAVGTRFAVSGEVAVTFAAAGGDSEIGKAVIYMAYVRPQAAHGVS